MGKPQGSPNKVSEQDVRDAIEFLHTMGMVEEMTSDKRHYTEVLLKASANTLNINLGLD